MGLESHLLMSGMMNPSCTIIGFFWMHIKWRLDVCPCRSLMRMNRRGRSQSCFCTYKRTTMYTAAINQSRMQPLFLRRCNLMGSHSHAREPLCISNAAIKALGCRFRKNSSYTKVKNCWIPVSQEGKGEEIDNISEVHRPKQSLLCTKFISTALIRRMWAAAGNSVSYWKGSHKEQ